MDYIFRRLALDYLTFEERSQLGIYSAEERQRHLETGSYEPLVEETGSASELLEPLVEEGRQARHETKVEDIETKDTHGSEAREVPAHVTTGEAKTTAELFEKLTGTAVDSPLCMTCGTKMRPAGSCYVCEGCGSTSGCS
jgi:ribonucleoside-diphosphate reductase alpha chain